MDNFIKEPIVAEVILNKKKKVLICQRGSYKKVCPDAWHLPGGKVEEGKSFEQAIIEEPKKELGFKS